MEREELLVGLNKQLNCEVTRFIRYMLQVALIQEDEYKAVRQMYLENVRDAVAHAQYLANQIVILGGTPQLAPDLTPPPSEARQMVNRDAQKEEIDVKNYMHLASLAREAGLLELKKEMEKQAAKEEEHSQVMQRLGYMVDHLD